MNQDLATATAQITAVATEVAQLLQFTGWEIQDGAYNGAYFHVLYPNYSLINPAEGITNFLLDPSQPMPVGAKTGTTTITDRVRKKITEYVIPNREGNVLEEYGTHSPTITIIGLVTGPNSMNVFQSQLEYFLDSALDSTVPQSQQVGTISGTDFRVLIHPVFGIIPNVMLEDYEILLNSTRHNSMAYKLMFKVPDPSYLKDFSVTTTWQTNVQGYLTASEVAANEIVQTFSLASGITTHSYPYNESLQPVPQEETTLPILDTRGVYLSSTVADITLLLTELAAIFTNSIAYLVQFSGGEIVNSFYDSIAINYNVLPVYAPNNKIFQFSDAQSLLTNYTNKINDFFDFINNFNYDYFLQPNIIALSNSVVYMNDTSEGILLKNNTLTEFTLNTSQALFSFALQNGVTQDNLDDVAQRNSGKFFDALLVPAGTTIELII